MVRKIEFYDIIPMDTLISGTKYWTCIVALNSKYSGLIKNVKPFELILTNIKNKGNDITDFSWDMPNCKTKMMYPEFELYFNGYVCDTKEECIQQYNHLMDESANDVRIYLSKKYKKTHIKGIQEKILKNKIL